MVLPSMSDAELPPIVQAGAPVLRAQARAIRPDELGGAPLLRLVDAMIAVMRKAPGVGLAAPQIGVGVAVVVLEDREDLMQRLPENQKKARDRRPFPLTVLVNPRLRFEGGTTATFLEGCLSVPGYMALVERSLEVVVNATDAYGNPVALREKGWPARILQHELDHLAGTLYVDRMLSRSFSTSQETAARWIGCTTDEIKAGLGVR